MGVQYSAFNLKYADSTVECYYQGSKVFAGNIQYPHLYSVSSLEAKKFSPIWSSGPIISFCLNGIEYPTEPRTVFYDWLYVNALIENGIANNKLLTFDCFTDIQARLDIDACQARSVCIYKLLVLLDELEITSDFNSFYEWHKVHVIG